MLTINMITRMARKHELCISASDVALIEDWNWN